MFDSVINGWPEDRSVTHLSQEVDAFSDQGLKFVSHGPAPRTGRRLYDKILGAFHHACDVGDYDVAGKILNILELMLIRMPINSSLNRRRKIEGLVLAHERLWDMQHLSDR